NVFLHIRTPVEYMNQYLAIWDGSNRLYDIITELFDHFHKLSIKYYLNTNKSEIVYIVINDVDKTKHIVINVLMNVRQDLVNIAIDVIIMLTMDVWLTIVAIILFPLYRFAVKYLFGTLRKLTRERSQALAETQGHLHERVQGIPVTRSFA